MALYHSNLQILHNHHKKCINKLLCILRQLCRWVKVGWLFKLLCHVYTASQCQFQEQNWMAHGLKQITYYFLCKKASVSWRTTVHVITALYHFSSECVQRIEQWNYGLWRMVEPQNVPWGELTFNRDLFCLGRVCVCGGSGEEKKTRTTSSF